MKRSAGSIPICCFIANKVHNHWATDSIPKLCDESRKEDDNPELAGIPKVLNDYPWFIPRRYSLTDTLQLWQLECCMPSHCTVGPPRSNQDYNCRNMYSHQALMFLSYKSRDNVTWRPYLKNKHETIQFSAYWAYIAVIICPLNHQQLFLFTVQYIILAIIIFTIKMQREMNRPVQNLSQQPV